MKPAVRVQLPSLLEAVTHGRRELGVEASTLREAFDVLASQHPRLAVHLLDEDGAVRPHVLCFHNGRNTRWLDDCEVALQSGDTLTFMQAVTGG